MKVLITGANGYIAKSLSNNLTEYNITTITRQDFDLVNRNATNDWFKDKYFDVVIHTAVVGGSRLKTDDGETFYQNIQMFYNLLNNKHCFNNLIHFGSGAELGIPDSPYGMSKNVINRIIKHEPNFHNIRIFAVFDENELNTRFIKSSIKKYINKTPIQIHQDKLMDFFYVGDLVKLVKHIITLMEFPFNDIPKTIDCSYNKSLSLLEITNIINSLSNYKVDVEVGDIKGDNYIGFNSGLDIKWIGLEKGIKNVYKKLLNETN